MSAPGDAPEPPAPVSAPSWRSRLRRVGLEGSWVGLGQVSSLLARLVGFRIITELVDPGIFGEAALLIGAVTLGRAVFVSPFFDALLRFHPDAVAQDNLVGLRRVAIRLTVWGGAAATVLLAVGSALWKAGGLGEVPDDATSGWALALMVPLLWVDVHRLFETSWANAERDQQRFALWTSGDAWARILAGALFLWWLGPSTTVLLAGYAVGAALVNAVFARRKTPPPSSSNATGPELRSAVLRYAAPLAPLAALGWITTMGDRYALGGLVGAADVGIYAAATGLASQPFFFVASTVALTLRPILFDAFARKDLGKRRQTLLLWVAALTGAFVPGLWLMHLLSQTIVEWLLGERFWEAAPLLVWIGAAAAVQGYLQAFSVLLYATGQTHRLIAIHVCQAGAAIAAYFLWIPEHGALGAAWAILASKIIGLLVTFAVSHTGSVLLAKPIPECDDA